MYLRKSYPSQGYSMRGRNLERGDAEKDLVVVVEGKLDVTLKYYVTIKKWNFELHTPDRSITS